MASRIVPQNLPQTEHSADPNALPAFLSDLLAAVREQVTEPPTHTRHTSETYALVSSAARVATKGIRQDMRFRALLARLDALGMAWAGDALYRIAHDPARGEALATQLVSALEQAEPTRRVRLMGQLVTEGLLQQMNARGLEAVICSIESPGDDCAAAAMA